MAGTDESLHKSDSRTLLVSEPILNEIEAVLSRPAVQRKLPMTPIEAGALIELLRRRTRVEADPPSCPPGS